MLVLLPILLHVNICHGKGVILEVLHQHCSLLVNLFGLVVHGKIFIFYIKVAGQY
jgi:hypothetical protein